METKEPALQLSKGRLGLSLFEKYIVKVRGDFVVKVD
jgi:hypothetical protein